MILFIMLIVQKVSAQTRETAARLSERILDPNGRDAKSHLVKCTTGKCHKYSKMEHFCTIGKG